MNQKHKIAVIGLKGLPAFGGAATVGENIIEYLKDEYEFTVYATSSHTDLKTGNFKNYRQIVFNKIPLKKLNLFYYFIISALHALLFKNYDLVHIHHRDAAFIIFILKLKYKVIITTHGSFFYTDKSKNYNWFFKINEKYFVKHADAVTCVSKIEEKLYNKRVGIKVNHIPNGINLIDTSTLPIIKYNNYIFFAAGRIIRSKGLHILLKVLHILNYQEKLIIVGDLFQASRYSNEIDKLSKGLNVVYLGLIKEKSLLYSYLNKSNLFIFPSEIEAMSMMLLEAASLKSPIICSDIQSNKDIFNSNEVLFFNSGNIDDLAEKLNYALTNPNKMFETAQRAFEKVNSNYNWEKIAMNYSKIYNSFL